MTEKMNQLMKDVPAIRWTALILLASAISFPLNHLTIPRETVIPAISTPQPKNMKPIADIFADAGMPS